MKTIMFTANMLSLTKTHLKTLRRKPNGSDLGEPCSHLLFFRAHTKLKVSSFTASGRLNGAPSEGLFFYYYLFTSLLLAAVGEIKAGQ